MMNFYEYNDLTVECYSYTNGKLKTVKIVHRAITADENIRIVNYKSCRRVLWQICFSVEFGELVVLQY